MNIAIFQSACAGLSSAEKIDRLSRYIVEYNEIERDPLDLVICPELFITGYNVGDELIKNAEPAQGTSFTAIARLCQQLNTAIVFGYAEVFGDGGTTPRPLSVKMGIWLRTTENSSTRREASRKNILRPGIRLPTWNTTGSRSQF